MRTIELKIPISPIELGAWASPGAQPLIFVFDRKEITGKLFINLDDDRIVWDYQHYTDHDTGEEEINERPLRCDQITIRIEGEYINEPADRKVSSAESLATFPFLTPSLEIEVSRDYNAADVMFLAVAHELSIEYLANLVDYINFNLGQYWIELRQISSWGMWYFFQETKACWADTDEKYKGQVIHGIAQYLRVIDDEPGPPPFYDQSEDLDEVHWSNMQESIKLGGQVDLTKRLILNAKRHLVNNDYRMATVESIAALEVQIVNFVEKRMKNKGVSNKALDSYRIDLGIAGYLKVLLPLVLDRDELDSWLTRNSSRRSTMSNYQLEDSKSVVASCLELNSLRNNVVHEGVVPAEKKGLIKRGIVGIELLIKFILDN